MSLIENFKNAKVLPPFIFIKLPNNDNAEITLKFQRPSPTELSRLVVKAQKTVDSNNSSGNINGYCLAVFEALQNYCVDWEWHTEEKIEFTKENKQAFFDSLIDDSLTQVVALALIWQQELSVKKKSA